MLYKMYKRFYCTKYNIPGVNTKDFA